MARIDGGEMLIRVLKQAGVGEIFALHGGHLDAVFQAALDHHIRLIDTRHEQAAGHAADGFARATGRPGVAVVTAGPGVTDVITAVANAYLDAIPTLFIGGASPTMDAETLPLQGGFDQVALMRPITKWAHRITHPQRLPDLVAQGLRLATTGRPGPVFLEIPADVMFRQIEESEAFFPHHIVPQGRPTPAAADVRQAIDWLLAAARPIILLGGGAWFSGAGAELVRFVEDTGIPVVANTRARGVLPEDHPLSGRSVSTLGVLGQMSGQRPDVVLILGARLGLFTAGRSGLVVPPDARVIQVDIEAEEIGRNRDIELGIVADVRETVRALHAEARGRSWPEHAAWQETVRQGRRYAEVMFADALAPDRAPIHPFRLAHTLSRFLGPDAILAVDGGETTAWMDMAALVRRGGACLGHGYLGCLGVGMPFAIGAKAAYPDRQVACIIGDGSVGFNFAEFDTMARHRLNIVTIINNDQQWGMSAHGQELVYGKDRTVITALGPTRYDLAAAGFGCHAELVERPEELVPALERAFASNRPACVNVMTDPDAIPPITLMMAAASTGPEDSSVVRMPYFGARKF